MKLNKVEAWFDKHPCLQYLILLVVAIIIIFITYVQMKKVVTFKNKQVTTQINYIEEPSLRPYPSITPPRPPAPTALLQ